MRALLKLGFTLIAAFLFIQTSRADEWSLKDVAGVNHTLSGLRGKWVLVNFWAPWCPSCLQEIPELVSLQKEERKDLQILGVAVMYRSRREVMDIVQKEAIPYPIVLGSEEVAGDFGGMSGMPTSFLYSPAGKLAGRIEGPLKKIEIEKAIAH